MRQYLKPTLFATMLLIAVFAPRSGALGQSNGHFEWAKGFGTSDPTKGRCHITGSVTDSVGNLYILGQFRNDSEWGTGWTAERLLPMAPYGPWPNNINTIIAKISPEGNMVWKKVIHSNNGTSHDPLDIKKVGDTAFACLVNILLPSEDNYTYYLDTLIPDRSDYPISSLYFRNTLRTAFIMFDFEGNVLEQHFLFTTYTDTAGNDIVKYYPDDTIPWYSCHRFRSPSFDIDAEGNIYICRASMDWLNDSVNAQNGAIRGIKFWVDNRKVGECINESKPMFWYPQIMKFSPHFDTMLACRYIVQKNNNIEYDIYDQGIQTKIGADNNIYIRLSIPQLANLTDLVEDTIVIDSTQNIFIFHTNLVTQKDFVVQLNTELTPNWLITLDDSVISEGPCSGLGFQTVEYYNNSNLLFISGATSRAAGIDTVNFYSILTYQGMPLRMKNDAFFLAFKLDSTKPELYSYGKVPAIYVGFCCGEMINGMVCKDNRIFMQNKFQGGMRLPGQTITFNSKYDCGLGLSIFDFQGKVIGGINYNSISTDNRSGPVSLHDSTLYLMGRLFVDATFGDIHFSTNGLQYAYIAKYVDPALMLPYTGDTGDVNIMLTPDVGVFTAYPNPFRQRVNIKIENAELKAVNGRVTAMLTDITGRSEEVPLATQGDGQYVLDLTARPQASYYLTLTTADGCQHTVQLLKQSDRFGDQ